MKNTLLVAFSAFFWSCAENATKQDDLPLPNILWITSEDNSPFAGCYGDEFATTPNMDKLAAEGFLYTHAYANAPVCAPTRNTIITGVYANSGGHEHMRSFYDKSSIVKLYPEYLREAGYYCTNNQKEDFNINPELTQNTWDELGKDAHYKNRPEGKPFFAIFNSTISHESSLHKRTPLDELRHKPEDVKLPPYHPDTPDMRHDWAQYYDKIEDMDTWMGGILKELEESGERENTIVFYYGDHGGVLARSKRFVYESGTRVPFVVYIPEKYKHLYPTEKKGSKIDRLISFVDLVPTLLSIIGTDIPDYLQGHAFLGSQKSDDPEYAFMFRGRMDERYDMSRAVRDKRYRYIKNYMPYRIYGQYIDYLWRAPSIRSWEAAYLAGECDEIQSIFWNRKPLEELYDTENDPWEVNNLANDPQHGEILQRMRMANRDWVMEIGDIGFIPEGTMVDLTEGTAPYDYMRSGNADLSKIVEAADYATSKDAEGQRLAEYLMDGDPSISYWGATGLLIMGEKARPLADDLKKAALEGSLNAALVAAESLYFLGDKDTGRKTVLRALASENPAVRTHALNVVDNVQDNSPVVRQQVVDMVKRVGEFDPKYYDLRMAKALFDKWEISAETIGIDMNW